MWSGWNEKLHGKKDEHCKTISTSFLKTKETIMTTYNRKKYITVPLLKTNHRLSRQLPIKHGKEFLLILTAKTQCTEEQKKHNQSLCKDILPSTCFCCFPTRDNKTFKRSILLYLVASRLIIWTIIIFQHSNISKYALLGVCRLVSATGYKWINT